MKTISRYIMTLALLLTAVTGAMATTVTWVTDDFFNTSPVTFTKYDVTVTTTNDARTSNYFYNSGVNTFTTTLGNFTKIEIVFRPESSPVNISGWNYEVIESFQPDPEMMPGLWEYTSKLTWTGDAESVSIQGLVMNILSITFTITDPNAVDFEWDASTKTGTFTQPASDVVLTPIYAKAAAFATTGTEPDVKTLLPEAAEGVIAGTDASLIAEGTGIVAFAGTSTEVKQGTLMYAIGTSATEAPALTAFSATVPTAENVGDDGADVYVWYYIQGADAPDGVAATLDNTFNNSDICATPLTVKVLSNKFDLTLKAANANTIDATQASKGTVSVKEGTGAAVDKTGDITDEGKLKAIKMGSEVKLNAKQGYKFRKVEVKKKASTPTLKDALADGATVVITYTWMGTNITTFTYTKNGGNYTGSTTGDDAAYFANGMSMDGTTLKFTASNLDVPEANVSIDFFTDSNEYSAVKGSLYTSLTISVNGTDITSQLTGVK